MKKFCLPLAVVLCFAVLTACYQEGGTNSDITSNGVSSAITQSEIQSNTTSTVSSEISKTESMNVSATVSVTPQVQTPSQNTSQNTPSKPPETKPKPTIEEIAATNKQKAQEIILKNTTPEMTDIEKIKATYKWLYPNFKYRTASVDLSNGFTKELETELAAYYFKYGKGSCEHYAAAQKVIINELGYDCVYVMGERYSSNYRAWGEHVWLMVNVSDNWYHVDGLFGGLFYNVIETTFMVPDTAIEHTHRWDKTAYPACMSPQLLK